MKNKLLNIRSLFIAAILIGTAFLSTSCKKYLSPAPISTFDPSIAFSNIPNTKAALMGAYMELAGDYGYGIRASYYYPYDDDCIMGGGAGLDQARHQEAHYTIQAGNADIVNNLNQFYAGIERANLCIYYIPLMPQYTSGAAADKTELQRMLGEALILRAQFYFEIVRIWGDVPAQWVPSSFVNNLFLPQTSRDTIYNHLINDLYTASGLMAWRTLASSQDERFTKGTALALRAKIALFRVVTPVSRRNFDKDGNAKETHVEYTKAVFEIGEQYKVPVIDLDKKSREIYQKMGPIDAKILFMELDSAEHPNYPVGRHDNTHFNEFGARKMAEIVLNEIKAQHLELADRIVKGQNKAVVNPQAK